MPVPQAGAQQRQDLTSYYIGNLNDQNAQRQRAASDTFGNVLDLARTAYGIGSAVDQTIKQEDAQRAAGLEAELTAVATENGTQPFDNAKLRARMVLNPDLAQKLAQLDRYKSTGRLSKPTDDKAPIGDVVGNFLRTGQLETSYGKIKGDEAVKTEDFLNSLAGGDYTNVPALVDLKKQFGDTIDASERKVLQSVYGVYTGTDQESKNALSYAADLGGWAYMGGERGEDGQPLPTSDAQLQPIGLAPQEGTAQAQPGGATTGQPPLQAAGPNLLGAAGSAASQAQGRMEPRGQVGATNRKPLILGMAPGMTTETVRAAQGTPQLQAAYAAAPANLAAYWGVKPEAVQAAYAGLSETGLPADPQQRQRVLQSWAQQIQTALPGVFPQGQPAEQTVKEALALRSGAAHTALSSVLKGGQPTLPVGPDGQPILYVPNTGAGVQAPTEPTTPVENKVAQTGGMTEVGFSTGIQPRQEQEGVALGVDANVLASAEMKAAQGLPLTKDETLARNNLHRVANAHVKVNGDVLVRGVPLKDLIKDYDQKLPQIENGIRKLNGMGLTVEDMMDPTLTDFQGYMAVLKPAQAAFVEKNKPIQDLINNIISFKQDTHAQENIDLAGKTLGLQQQELAHRIKAHQDNLKLQYAQIGADGALADPNSTAAQKAAAEAQKRLQTSYNQYLTRWNTAVTTLGGFRKALEYVERNKNRTDDVYVTLYKNIVETGKALTGDPTFQVSEGAGAQAAPTTPAAGPRAAPPTTPLSGTGTSTSNVDNFMSRYSTR